GEAAGEAGDLGGVPAAEVEDGGAVGQPPREFGDEPRPWIALDALAPPAVALRVPLAGVEDGEAERDGDEADHDQRPDVAPDVGDAGAVEDRVADAAE